MGRTVDRRRLRGRHCASVFAVVCIVVSAGVPSGAAVPSPVVPITISASGANGAGRITTPGRPCADGGEGGHWHYDYGAPLADGAFSNLPGDLRMHLDLHTDDDGPLIDPPADPPFAGAGATPFLLGRESHVTLNNARGRITLALIGGSCGEPGDATFDGKEASAEGAWEVVRGVGAYRDATGTGTYALTADVTPGADNTFDVVLDGNITIVPPAITVQAVDAYWGLLGVDYLRRRVTVVYRITNTGAGDSFGARLTGITSSTNGVEPVGVTARPLGDLRPEESELVTVRYQLGLLSPCRLVILNCRFDTTLSVDIPDAFDRSNTQVRTLRVRAPTAPPPL